MRVWCAYELASKGAFRRKPLPKETAGLQEVSIGRAYVQLGGGTCSPTPGGAVTLEDGASRAKRRVELSYQPRSRPGGSRSGRVRVRSRDRPSNCLAGESSGFLA